MKTKNRSSSTPPVANDPRRQSLPSAIRFLLVMGIALLQLLLTTACDHDVDPSKRPDPISSLPGSGTSTAPGTGTTTKPGNTTSTPPGSSTGNNGPATAFRTFRITYASTDFQEVQYDAADQPVSYRSQATTVLGGNGIVQQRQFQFMYRPGGQLQRVEQAGGNYFLYQYDSNNQVSRVDEYTPKGRPLFARTYQYSATGQLVQLDEKSMTDTYVGRKTYQYDGLGNLTTCTHWLKVPGQDDYQVETTTTFADFDQGKHVENLFAAFPFLPDVTFYANTYRTKIVRFYDGREMSRETYTYVYDAQGKPVQRTTRYASQYGEGTLSAMYSY